MFMSILYRSSRYRKVAAAVRQPGISTWKSLRVSDSSAMTMLSIGGDMRFRTTGGKIRDGLRRSLLGFVVECIDEVYIR